MSSSSVATEATRTIAPPKGWTNEEEHMLRDAMWFGVDGVRESMNTCYGLENAEPIWREDPKFGNFLFIFQAKDSPGRVCYYVLNAVSDGVWLIDAPGLDEIRDHISQFGEGEKTLGKLKLTEIFS